MREGHVKPHASFFWLLDSHNLACGSIGRVTPAPQEGVEKLAVMGSREAPHLAKLPRVFPELGLRHALFEACLVDLKAFAQLRTAFLVHLAMSNAVRVIAEEAVELPAYVTLVPEAQDGLEGITARAERNLILPDVHGVLKLVPKHR